MKSTATSKDYKRTQTSTEQMMKRIAENKAIDEKIAAEKMAVNTPAAATAKLSKTGGIEREVGGGTAPFTFFSFRG
jgi:hypothetical protein